jgi:hypothetical protein
LVLAFLTSILSHLRHRRYRRVVLCSLLLVTGAGGAMAQTITVKQWRGTSAMIRQPEQAFANTNAEWRSLWSRVGMAAPDQFEPGRTCAVGIFLGARAGNGYSVNILSASRRRDRVMVVFEERAPDDIMMAQRMMPPPPAARPVGAGQAFTSNAPTASFGPSGIPAGLPPMQPRPAGPSTSPWAIVLINRADLPITVEQRLFR